MPAIALTWHAIYTGGPLPAAASWWSHLMYRVASAATLWACVEPINGEWRATTLYHQIETTDKSQASYRLGTVMAGVAGEFALGIEALTHRQTMFGSSSGSRGDLVGRRLGPRSWHGIEAKGHSPERATGLAQTVSPTQRSDAKAQAQSLGSDLRRWSYPTGHGDNWAVHALGSMTAPFELRVDDPPGEDRGSPPPLDPDADFPDDDPEERLLQGYYQVVGDIEQALSVTTTNEPRGLALIDGFRGVQVPGTALWLGAHRELFSARRDRRLARVMDDIAYSSRVAEPTRYTAMGLAVVTLTPAM